MTICSAFGSADAADRAIFPLSHGVPRVDDRLVISRYRLVIRMGFAGVTLPAGYGPHKTSTTGSCAGAVLGVLQEKFSPSWHARLVSLGRV